MGSPFFTYPPVTPFDNAARCACLAFERSGLPHDVGRRLGSLYTAAGLPFPELMAEIPVGGPGSAITGWAVQTLRTLLPMIEQLGIATAAEIGIDTLRQRIEAEARENNAVLTGPPQFGAWARKP